MNKRQIKAADAQQMLESPVFNEVFNKVADYIENKAVGCDPDSKGMAQRIVLSKQILAHIKREFVRLVDDGLMADHEVKIDVLEEKKGLIAKVLRR